VVYADTKESAQHQEEGLRAFGRDKAKGRGKVDEKPDPVRETGAPSTGRMIVRMLSVACPPHRG
jgi:hypothetical protein